MESCSKPPKMWFKHYEHRVTDRGRKGKVKNADFQDRSSSNSSSSRHLHFTELLETFHGRWSRATLWETLYGGHGGLGHVPIWLGSGTFHGSKFPWCCYTVGVRSFIHPSFFLPVNHLRGGKKKKRQWILSSFTLVILAGVSRLCPPSSPHPIHWQSHLRNQHPVRDRQHIIPSLMPPGQHDCCGSSMDFSARPEAQVLPLPSCTALGKSLTISKLWFLHL